MSEAIPERNSRQTGAARDYVFPDFPDFTPNLSPREIFERGSFGGSYWRSITSAVTHKVYPSTQHLEFAEWWSGMDDALLNSPVENVDLNRYKVHSGSSLAAWESQHWIHAQDPYGWVQWYCRFFRNRRTADDRRQIDRWKRFAGPRGRFRVRLANLIQKRGAGVDDASISPVIRQGLQHWAFVLCKRHLTASPRSRRRTRSKK